MSWLLLAVLGGCAWRVELRSDPGAALVRVDGRPVGTTPMELRLGWRPFYRPAHRVSLRLPGHRDVGLDVGPRSRGWWLVGWNLLHPAVTFGLAAPRTWTVLMVPVHGPVGTWSPEEAERERR